MHSRYVVGYLYDVRTAAQDPIFWSFHTFIDLLYAQWQQMPGHVVDTCLTCTLTWNTPLPNYQPYTIGQVSQPIVDGFIPIPDPGPDKGYSYEYTPPAPPTEGALESVSAELFPTHPAKDFAASGQKEPEAVETMAITIPEPGFSEGQVRLKGVTLGTPFPYSGDIYLSPQDVAFNPRDFDFREKYFVNLISIWMGHEGHEGHGDHNDHGAGNTAHGMHDVDILVDLTPQLRSLAATHAGETWNLNVALVTLEDEQQPQGMLEAVEGSAAPADIVKLRDMQLEIK
jgi:tyrosinase